MLPGLVRVVGGAELGVIHVVAVDLVAVGVEAVGGRQDIARGREGGRERRREV